MSQSSSIEIRPLTVSIGGALILAGLLPSNHPIRQADKTAHAQVVKGVFPFPMITIAGSKRRYLVRVVDVEQTLAHLVQRSKDLTPHVPMPVPTKRGRGRPRKVVRQAEAGP